MRVSTKRIYLPFVYVANSGHVPGDASVDGVEDVVHDLVQVLEGLDGSYAHFILSQILRNNRNRDIFHVYVLTTQRNSASLLEVDLTVDRLSSSHQHQQLYLTFEFLDFLD